MEQKPNAFNENEVERRLEEALLRLGMPGKDDKTAYEVVAGLTPEHFRAIMGSNDFTPREKSHIRREAGRLFE